MNSSILAFPSFDGIDHFLFSEIPTVESLNNDRGFEKLIMTIQGIMKEGYTGALLSHEKLDDGRMIITPTCNLKTFEGMTVMYLLSKIQTGRDIPPPEITLSFIQYLYTRSQA